MRKLTANIRRLQKAFAILLIAALSAAFLPAKSFAEYTDSIIIRVGSDVMISNGIEKEIDPGRGTVSILESNRVLVPIRALVEEMGGTVTWNQNDLRVNISLEDTNIKLWINQTLAVVNGKSIIMDVPVRMENFRTLVPLRFVAERMGAEVSWEGKSKEATIRYNKKVIPIPAKPQFSVSDEFDTLEGNMGRIIFKLTNGKQLGEHTGFKVYYTNEEGKTDHIFFDKTDENTGFYCTDTIGKTVSLEVAAVNETVESERTNIEFAMLDRAEKDEIWFEAQMNNLPESKYWFGLSWLPVPEAEKYMVYASDSIADWHKFNSTGYLSGFHQIITVETYLSTKEMEDFPEDLANPSVGEKRYVVVFPMNDNGIKGPIPAWYEILIA